MTRYAEAQVKRGVPLRIIVRGLLGWMAGTPGARGWRRTLSDVALLKNNDPALIGRAWEAFRNAAGTAGHLLPD